MVSPVASSSLFFGFGVAIGGFGFGMRRGGGGLRVLGWRWHFEVWGRELEIEGMEWDGMEIWREGEEN